MAVSATRESTVTAIRDDPRAARADDVAPLPSSERRSGEPSSPTIHASMTHPSEVCRRARYTRTALCPATRPADTCVPTKLVATTCSWPPSSVERWTSPARSGQNARSSVTAHGTWSARVVGFQDGTHVSTPGATGPTRNASAAGCPSWFRIASISSPRDSREAAPWTETWTGPPSRRHVEAPAFGGVVFIGVGQFAANGVAGVEAEAASGGVIVSAVEPAGTQTSAEPSSGGVGAPREQAESVAHTTHGQRFNPPPARAPRRLARANGRPPWPPRPTPRGD